MYICMCGQIKSSDIEAAVAKGATDMHSLQMQLNIAKGCGRCKDFAKEVIQQSMAKTLSTIALTYHQGASMLNQSVANN